MKALSGLEAVESQRETGSVAYLVETAGAAFEVGGNIGVDHVPVVQCHPHIGTWAAAKGIKRGRGNLDLQMLDRRAGKKGIGFGAMGFRGRFSIESAQPTQKNEAAEQSPVPGRVDWPADLEVGDTAGQKACFTDEGAKHAALASDWLSLGPIQAVREHRVEGDPIHVQS